jgi:phytoene/squalene synthetase
VEGSQFKHQLFLPDDELAELVLSTGDLLNKSNSARASTALAPGIERALEHCIAAGGYVLSIPSLCPWLRLAPFGPS